MNSMYLLGFMLNTLVQNFPVDKGLQSFLFVPTHVFGTIRSAILDAIHQQASNLPVVSLQRVHEAGITSSDLIIDAQGFHFQGL